MQPQRGTHDVLVLVLFSHLSKATLACSKVTCKCLCTTREIHPYTTKTYTVGGDIALFPQCNQSVLYSSMTQREREREVGNEIGVMPAGMWTGDTTHGERALCPISHRTQPVRTGAHGQAFGCCWTQDSLSNALELWKTKLALAFNDQKT